MRFNLYVTIQVACAPTLHASSLADVCTVSHLQESLPPYGTFLGLRLHASSITTAQVYNASTKAGKFFPAATYNYCNVTLSYSHNERGDNVQLQLWFPAPDSFQKRYLATGGGGLSINSGTQSLPGGVMYGAVAGITDGGFDGFSTQVDAVLFKANGTINWDIIHMFGYEAIEEMTQIKKGVTRLFYGMKETDKLYTYYQACSKVGRKGWSQVQRYGEEYDRVIPGAPALRYAQQQVQHLYSNVVEQNFDYYPRAASFIV